MHNFEVNFERGYLVLIYYFSLIQQSLRFSGNATNKNIGCNK